MNDKIFNKLQNDIMKILTRSNGDYISQYKLYDEILEEFDIKDPLEKENLKMKFLIVLRTLPFTFEYINIINKNGSLHIKFLNSDESSTDESSDNSSDDSFEKKPKDLPFDLFKEESTEIKNVMPTDISVVNFIIDENIEDYFYRKDYEGNTLLHSLILNNDYLRIKKNFNKLKKLINVKNNNNETPIEIINDNRISNLFLNQLIIDNNNLKKDILLLNNFSKDQYILNYIVYSVFFVLSVANIVQLVKLNL